MFAILGASGRAGGTAARELRRLGHPVRAIVRNPDSAAGLRDIGCEIAVADLHDAAATRRALDGAERVFVICPMTPRSDDAFGEAKEVIETVALALEESRPEAIVAVSDYGAQHETGTGITLIFHHLEQRIGRIPAAVTFLRSAEHMETWARQIRTAPARGFVTSLHLPESKIFPTVSAHDVGRIAAEILSTSAVATAGVRVVHVEGPRRYTAGEIADAVSRLAGQQLPARALPMESWPAYLSAAGLSESYSGLVVGVSEAHNAGRIEIEEGGEVIRGATELAEAIAAELRRQGDPA